MKDAVGNLEYLDLSFRFKGGDRLVSGSDEFLMISQSLKNLRLILHQDYHGYGYVNQKSILIYIMKRFHSTEVIQVPFSKNTKLLYIPPDPLESESDTNLDVPTLDAGFLIIQKMAVNVAKLRLTEKLNFNQSK